MAVSITPREPARHPDILECTCRTTSAHKRALQRYELAWDRWYASLSQPTAADFGDWEGPQSPEYSESDPEAYAEMVRQDQEGRS
jgi:hypothetical protein